MYNAYTHNYMLIIFILQGEESNSSANKNMLKVALHAATLENYERATQIYEQVQFYNLHSTYVIT